MFPKSSVEIYPLPDKTASLLQFLKSHIKSHTPPTGPSTASSATRCPSQSAGCSRATTRSRHRTSAPPVSCQGYQVPHVEIHVEVEWVELLLEIHVEVVGVEVALVELSVCPIPLAEAVCVEHADRKMSKCAAK